MLDQSQDNTAAGWHARARAVHPSALALINGALVPAQSGETFECMSPIDGRKLAPTGNMYFWDYKGISVTYVLLDPQREVAVLRVDRFPI